jgi:LPXTG-site transpeptidase (sortase) family protein
MDGSLVPPSDYTTVGWWAGGPAPGSDEGTAIITGHTVHTGGGAFDELGQLRPGDRVVVARPRRDLEYVVARVTSYEKGTLATHAARVFSLDSEGRLALVTCGDWNGETYLSNVVVIATNPRPLAP